MRCSGSGWHSLMASPLQIKLLVLKRHKKSFRFLALAEFARQHPSDFANTFVNQLARTSGAMFNAGATQDALAGVGYPSVVPQ